jgi:hypothetical protein
VKIEGGAETGPEVEAGAAAVVKAEVSTGTEREVEVQAEGQTEKGAGRERERQTDGVTVALTVAMLSTEVMSQGIRLGQRELSEGRDGEYAGGD